MLQIGFELLSEDGLLNLISPAIVFCKMAAAAYAQALRSLGLHPSQTTASGPQHASVSDVRALVSPLIRPVP